VINVSLGLPEYSSSLAAAIDFALGAGVVVSAGNEGAGNSNQFPASLNECMTAAATDRFDRKAEFSNYGPAVDPAAPGVAILSTYPGGSCAYWSCTSMAAPFVSGGLAVLESTGAFSRPEDAAERILEKCYPLGQAKPEYWTGLDADRISLINCLAFPRVRPGEEPLAK